MYFEMSQTQFLGLAILGGLLIVAILVIAFLSHRMNFARRGEGQAAELHEEGEEFPDGLRDGNKPIPLILHLLIAGLLIWGVVYTLAYAYGGLNVQ